MSSPIDISGIDKVELLKVLWENQKVAPFFTHMPQAAPRWDEALAKKELARCDKIDYFQGRCIKANLCGDTLSVSAYCDSDAAVPAATIVARLRDRK